MEQKQHHYLPTTVNETLVFDIWTQVLKHDHFSVEDDFFDIGGTSLQALQVISRLSETFELDLDEFFGQPTIRHIASCLSENSDAIKLRLAEVLHFRDLRKRNPKEWQEYEAKWRQLNHIQAIPNQYQTVLLLGATGFLGIYLLHELLEQTNATIVILIRLREQAEQQFRQQYDRYFGSDAYLQKQSRIQVVLGDLTHTEFGLSHETYQQLGQTVDAIVNSAALVKHMGKNTEFDAVNIKIVEELLTFARFGRPKVIHHMSTIGIAYGHQEDDQKTLFTEYDKTICHQLSNQYLSSKYQAERCLIEARTTGVESTIYRMNGILFDSTNGRYQQNISQSTAYLFYRALYQLRMIPTQIQRPMDVSNVDMVSRAIVCLMFSNYHKDQIHHVMNEHTVPVGKLLEMIAAHRHDISLQAMSVEESYTFYQQATAAQKKSFHELIFECEIIGAIAKNRFHICTQRTNHLLQALGFTWNEIDQEMIAKATAAATAAGFCQREELSYE